MSGTKGRERNTGPDFTERLPDTQREWILALLHAPDEAGRRNQPICGKKNIVQSLFLIDRRLVGMDVDSPFAYTGTKYGPVDDGISRKLRTLREEGKIERENEINCENDRMAGYSLTPNGEREGERVYDSLPGDVQELLKWVRANHTTSPLGELRTFLYSEDPTMFK